MDQLSYNIQLPNDYDYDYDYDMDMAFSNFQLQGTQTVDYNIMELVNRDIQQHGHYDPNLAQALSHDSNRQQGNFNAFQADSTVDPRNLVLSNGIPAHLNGIPAAGAPGFQHGAFDFNSSHGVEPIQQTVEMANPWNVPTTGDAGQLHGASDVDREAGIGPAPQPVQLAHLQHLPAAGAAGQQNGGFVVNFNTGTLPAQQPAQVPVQPANPPNVPTVANVGQQQGGSIQNGHIGGVQPILKPMPKNLTADERFDLAQQQNQAWRMENAYLKLQRSDMDYATYSTQWNFNRDQYKYWNQCKNRLKHALERAQQAN